MILCRRIFSSAEAETETRSRVQACVRVLRARFPWRPAPPRHHAAGAHHQPSHRVTGGRRDTVKGIGAEYIHVAIDHSRIAFSAHLPDKIRASELFLDKALATLPGSVSVSTAVPTHDGPMSLLRLRLLTAPTQASTHAALQPTHKRQGRTVHPTPRQENGPTRAPINLIRSITQAHTVITVQLTSASC